MRKSNSVLILKLGNEERILLFFSDGEKTGRNELLFIHIHIISSSITHVYVSGTVQINF